MCTIFVESEKLYQSVCHHRLLQIHVSYLSRGFFGSRYRNHFREIVVYVCDIIEKNVRNTPCSVVLYVSSNRSERKKWRKKPEREIGKALCIMNYEYVDEINDIEGRKIASLANVSNFSIHFRYGKRVNPSIVLLQSNLCRRSRFGYRCCCAVFDI